MSDILKTTLGFIGILLVGVVGVFVFGFMKLGDTNAPVKTVDNVAAVR